MSFARQNTQVLVDQKTALAASVTLPAIASGNDARRWRLGKVLASYSTNTQQGTVSITNVQGPNGPVTITRDLTGNDQGSLDFDDGIRTMPGVAVVITLSAGAASVVGNLTVIAIPE